MDARVFQTIPLSARGDRAICLASVRGSTVLVVIRTAQYVESHELTRKRCSCRKASCRGRAFLDEATTDGLRPFRHGAGTYRLISRDSLTREWEAPFGVAPWRGPGRVLGVAYHGRVMFMEFETASPRVIAWVQRGYCDLDQKADCLHAGLLKRWDQPSI